MIDGLLHSKSAIRMCRHWSKILEYISGPPQTEHDSTDHLGIETNEQQKESFCKIWKKDFDKVSDIKHINKVKKMFQQTLNTLTTNNELRHHESNSN